MQKKALFNPRQTLVLAYLLAVVLWQLRGLDVPPLEQNREMPHDEPPQVLISALSSAVVPGLADGVQVFCAM